MKYLSYPIITLLLILTLFVFIPIVIWGALNIATYQWMLYGMVGYIVIRQLFFKKNERWIQTFAHELSHTIVSIMFFRKIHSFHAEEGSGVIYHSGKRRFGDIFISLAPYCLPYLTYIFLLLSLIGAANMMYIFDLLIGFTFAFHIDCFSKQTRPYQTDIQKHGYIRSYLFIATALIFNTSIVLLSIRQGVVNAVINLFSQYWSEVNVLIGKIKLLGGTI